MDESCWAYPICWEYMPMYWDVMPAVIELSHAMKRSLSRFRRYTPLSNNS